MTLAAIARAYPSDFRSAKKEALLMTRLLLLPIMILISTSVWGHGDGDHDDHDSVDQAEVVKMHAAVGALHTAISTKNTAALDRALGAAFYRLQTNRASRATHWTPDHVFARDDYISNFKSSFEDTAFYYENAIEYVNTEVRPGSALVTTHEHGRFYRGGDWDVTNIWHVQEYDGEWGRRGHLQCAGCASSDGDSASASSVGAHKSIHRRVGYVQNHRPGGVHYAPCLSEARAVERRWDGASRIGRLRAGLCERV